MIKPSVASTLIMVLLMSAGFSFGQSNQSKSMDQASTCVSRSGDPDFPETAKFAGPMTFNAAGSSSDPGNMVFNFSSLKDPKLNFIIGKRKLYNHDLSNRPEFKCDAYFFDLGYHTVSMFSAPFHEFFWVYLCSKNNINNAQMADSIANIHRYTDDPTLPHINSGDLLYAMIRVGPYYGYNIRVKMSPVTGSRQQTVDFDLGECN